MKNHSLIGGLVVLVVIVFVYFIVGVSYKNNEVKLRNQFAAQLKVNESTFDKMWKILQQETQIATKERDSFKETYTEIMEAQSKAGGGSLATFLQSAGVNINSNLFEKLMLSIESQRESFNSNQIKLIQIKNEHDNIRTMFPGSWFVGNQEELDLRIVTSTRTSETFKTLKDDNVDLLNE